VKRLKLGILASHPIQYHAPLFRELCQHVDLRVFFAHRQTPQAQADAGFGVAFDWDVDLLDGYPHVFLANRARVPDVGRFWGCSTPDITREIATGDFDAFVVMGWSLRAYWQAVLACRRAGVPVSVRGDSHLGTPRGGVKTWTKQHLYPWLLRQFDTCLYVGQKNRDYLLHYGVREDRLFFSPHCVDNAWFAARATDSHRSAMRAQLGLDESAKVVLFVGKLIDLKRPMDMLAALHLLKEWGVIAHGVFAGDGPLRDDLAREGIHLAVPLHFLGFRNQTQLPAVYAAADALLLPSSSETWGLVVNEALACGTPVVVSDAVGCAPDLVHPASTGNTYTAGDVPGLAHALMRTLQLTRASDGIRSTVDAYSARAAATGFVQAAERTGQTLPVRQTRLG
jgi:glycosyltransferase involved in cell wall biosynthesis